jgi:hypothetical protein
MMPTVSQHQHLFKVTVGVINTPRLEHSEGIKPVSTSKYRDLQTLACQPSGNSWRISWLVSWPLSWRISWRRAQVLTCHPVDVHLKLVTDG